MVEQLADVRRAPQRRLRADQTSLNKAATALGSLTSELESLLNKAKALKEAQLYNTRGVSSTDTKVATASVGSSAYPGSFTFNFTQLASASVLRGGLNAGAGIDPNADMASNAAGFGVHVSTGRFTIDGEQIEVSTGDTLNDVLTRVTTQTGLEATYDPDTDKITLADGGGNPIILGSAADTSNFLQAARLTNNGTSSITSSHQLGGIGTSVALASARFNTAVTSGTFEINGVTFNVDATNDTIADVFERINKSAAGVAASYDSVNDRFVLTNKIHGDIGFASEEGTSNFLSATKLTQTSGGAITSGQDAQFTVNGGESLTSHNNAVATESHGIDGLTVNALSIGSASINISNDTVPLKQAIMDFVDQYNKVQSLIAIQTASSTDGKGVVTAGVLASDTQVAETSRKLRSLFASDTMGLSSTLKRLESLGYKSDGYSNQLSLENPAALNSALANSVNDVQAFFADASGGVAAQVSSYLEKVVGFDGSLTRHRDVVANQSAGIEDQVQKMEKSVLANQETMFDSFRAMEKTLAQINRQAAFFTQRFGLT